MKNFFIVAASTVTLLAALPAGARPVHPNERWCLNVSEYRGGAYRCSYATQDQCMASRTANGEWCMLNPELQAQDQRFYR